MFPRPLPAMPILLLLAAGCGLATLAAQDAPRCDLAKVERGFWCSGCKAALGAEGRDASGKCRACKDGGKVEETDLCLKTVHVCATCKDASLDAGVCPDCKVERTAHLVAARVLWACPACRAPGDGPGACPGADCKGAARARTCSAGGTFPHVAPGAK